MTSGCCVYAIVAGDASLPVNVDGLELVPCRGLAAVIAPAAQPAPTLSVEAVLRHESIVEAVRRQAPSLPVRFGTVFRDATSVAAAIAARYDMLAADLARLGDKLELSLTALWPEAASGADAPKAEGGEGRSAGAKYLHARAAQLLRDEAVRERAQAIAAELDRELGGLAVERRVALAPAPRVAVRAAYLLEQTAVRAFRIEFDALRGRGGELRLLLTGPWPPYSFVTQGAARGGAALEERFAPLVELLTEAMAGRPG